MTKLIYQQNSYLKEIEATVTYSEEDYIILNQTIFYPTSGGQLSDKGIISDVEVLEVKKELGKIKHFLKENPFKKGDKVYLKVNWNLRYKYMRMHSAQHLISAIILDKYGAETCGNQISDETSRLDFTPFKPTDQQLKDITLEFNRLVDEKLPIIVYTTSRDEVLATVNPARRKLFSRLPESIKEIRVIEIQDTDKCPCGGTHVKKTEEIGHINIIKTQNKGKDVTRLIFELE
jgi:misacylated tRNA(Ala) deacylase